MSAETVPAATIAATFVRALAGATRRNEPFRHWLLSGGISDGLARTLVDLPLTPPPSSTAGKRETHNGERSYCGVANRRLFGACDDLAQAFQGHEVVGAIEAACAVDLSGTFLRIEYCQDTEGFWLERHTDIGAKRFTLILGLSDGPGVGHWGTDLYDRDGGWFGRAPYGRGEGLAFVPGGDTWHGFEPRPIDGVRRSLIVNYVGPEWRARHELSFPDTPAGAPPPARRA